MPFCTCSVISSFVFSTCLSLWQRNKFWTVLWNLIIFKFGSWTRSHPGQLKRGLQCLQNFFLKTLSQSKYFHPLCYSHMWDCRLCPLRERKVTETIQREKVWVKQTWKVKYNWCRLRGRLGYSSSRVRQEAVALWDRGFFPGEDFSWRRECLTGVHIRRVAPCTL